MCVFSSRIKYYLDTLDYVCLLIFISFLTYEDVNLVTDPKPHQKKLKLKESSEPRIDSETEKRQIKSSEKTSPTIEAIKQPVKLEQSNSLFDTIMSSINNEQCSMTHLYRSHNFNINQNFSMNNSDLMICGSCKAIFHNFDLFVQHKRTLCLFASLILN